MYAQQSLQDTLFLMLYGAVAVLALVSGLYLWLRRSNTIAPDVTPPRALGKCQFEFFRHRHRTCQAERIPQLHDLLYGLQTVQWPDRGCLDEGTNLIKELDL